MDWRILLMLQVVYLWCFVMWRSPWLFGCLHVLPALHEVRREGGREGGWSVCYWIMTVSMYVISWRQAELHLHAVASPGLGLPAGLFSCHWPRPGSGSAWPSGEARWHMVVHSAVALSDSYSTNLAWLLNPKATPPPPSSSGLPVTCLLLVPTRLPAPKIVFNRPNGKKYHHPAPALPADDHQEETSTAAHEENVKFLYEGKEAKGNGWTGNTRTRHQSRLFPVSLCPPAILWMTLFRSEFTRTANQLPPPPPPLPPTPHPHSCCDTDSHDRRWAETCYHTSMSWSSMVTRAGTHTSCGRLSLFVCFEQRQQKLRTGFSELWVRLYTLTQFLKPVASFVFTSTHSLSLQETSFGLSSCFLVSRELLALTLSHRSSQTTSVTLSMGGQGHKAASLPHFSKLAVQGWCLRFKHSSVWCGNVSLWVFWKSCPEGSQKTESQLWSLKLTHTHTRNFYFYKSENTMHSLAPDCKTYF